MEGKKRGNRRFVRDALRKEAQGPKRHINLRAPSGERRCRGHMSTPSLTLFQIRHTFLEY